MVDPSPSPHGDIPGIFGSIGLPENDRNLFIVSLSAIASFFVSTSRAHYQPYLGLAEKNLYVTPESTSIEKSYSHKFRNMDLLIASIF